MYQIELRFYVLEPTSILQTMVTTHFTMCRMWGGNIRYSVSYATVAGQRRLVRMEPGIALALEASAGICMQEQSDYTPWTENQ